MRDSLNSLIYLLVLYLLPLNMEESSDLQQQNSPQASSRCAFIANV